MAAIRKHLLEKGQGLTEYVLILAFVAGVAMMFANGGLRDTVLSAVTDTNKIFAELFSGSNGNTYAAAFNKYSQMKWDELTNPETEAERLQADIDGLQKIADWFMGKTKDEVNSLLLTEYGDNSSGAIGNGETGVILAYFDLDANYDKNGHNYARYYKRNTPILELLGEGSGTATNDTYVYTHDTRYFFSDEMNSQTGDAEKQVKLKLTYENGVVTSSHVWVEQHKANQYASTAKDMSALDVQGKN